MCRALRYRRSVHPVDWILPVYRIPPLRTTAVHAGVFRTCLSAGTGTDSTRHHGNTRLARSPGYRWLATLGLHRAARLPSHHVKKLHRAGRTLFLMDQEETSNHWDSIMQTTHASAVAISRHHRRWESPWLWLLIGGMVGMYRMGPGGWSDVPLAMAEQLRLAASVLFVSFALDSRHQRREQGLFVLFGFAAFGLMQRSFGYYLELILLTTLVLALNQRRWLAIAFLAAATTALMLFVMASPYRVDQLANMSMDWLDSSREGHAAYAAMQQSVRLGGWFGTAAPEPAIFATVSETWFSWQLGTFCLTHGSAAILVWVAVVGVLFYWLTQRLRHIAEGRFRTALFVLAILLTMLAMQPVIEMHGGLPRWMAAHPITATAVSLALLTLVVLGATRNRGEVPSDLPRFWQVMQTATSALAGLVFVKQIMLVAI